MDRWGKNMDEPADPAFHRHAKIVFRRARRGYSIRGLARSDPGGFHAQSTP